MRNGSHIVIVIVLLLLAVVVPSEDLLAQCPMCRMTAESNLQNGGSGGKGLNAGILFMLSLPYLIVGSIGYIWYRNRKRLQAD